MEEEEDESVADSPQRPSQRRRKGSVPGLAQGLAQFSGSIKIKANQDMKRRMVDIALNNLDEKIAKQREETIMSASYRIRWYYNLSSWSVISF